MSTSVTKLAKLGIGSADPVDTYLRFVEFDAGVRREQYTAQGTAGTFFTDANLVRESRRSVGPTGSFEPTAAELAALLAWTFGAGVGTPTVVYTPTGTGETPTTRNVYWAPKYGEQYFLSSVAVDNFTLSANSGGPVSVALDLLGSVHDDTRNDFPAINPDVATSPFMLSDLTATGGVFTFAAATRQPNGFSLRVSNFLDRTRHLNSLELTRLQRMDMGFGVSFDVPSGDNPSLWSAGMTTPVSLTATFRNASAGAILSITAGGIMFPAQSPRHARGAEGFVTIDGTAYRTGGTGTPISISLRLSGG